MSIYRCVPGGNGDGSLTYPGRVNEIGGESFIPVCPSFMMEENPHQHWRRCRLTCRVLTPFFAFAMWVCCCSDCEHSPQTDPGRFGGLGVYVPSGTSQGSRGSRSCDEVCCAYCVQFRSQSQNNVDRKTGALYM